ncbi:MAG: 1-(5-phosphoribosyl)-5-[(5-phosphoribosylamino)methylideneamino]imidazole-4-carboxamide isomerase, partial [Chloroflexi bacterium]
MQIIPAIDIRGGRCVRLRHGDYAQETVFSDDPVAVAKRWQSQGAQRLHVVDLDGAREGRPVNQESLRAVIKAVGVPVQVGGGIRDIATINSYLEAGADRVALGTAAVKDQTTLINSVTLFRDRIIVGVDARDGLAAVEGWTETSSVRATELVRQLSEFGVSRIFYTDIGRDGVLSGPNFPAIQEIVEHAAGLPAPMAVIASGGISEIEHLKRLRAIGVEGAII